MDRLWANLRSAHLVLMHCRPLVNIVSTVLKRLDTALVGPASAKHVTWYKAHSAHLLGNGTAADIGRALSRHCQRMACRRRSEGQTNMSQHLSWTINAPRSCECDGLSTMPSAVGGQQAARDGGLVLLAKLMRPQLEVESVPIGQPLNELRWRTSLGQRTALTMDALARQPSRKWSSCGVTSRGRHCRSNGCPHCMAHPAV